MYRKDAISAARKALIGIGGKAAEKSKWMKEFEAIYAIGERFPGYSPEVLYRSGCGFAGVDPRPWEKVSRNERIGFAALRALINAFAAMIEPEPEKKPRKRIQKRPSVNQAAGRVTDDDDDNDPRAWSGIGPKPRKAAKKAAATAGKE